MSLYRAELRRLFKRRLHPVLLILLGLLVLAAVAVGTSLHQPEDRRRQRSPRRRRRPNSSTSEQALNDAGVGAECEAAKARGETTEDRYAAGLRGRSAAAAARTFEPKWYLPSSSTSAESSATR